MQISERDDEESWTHLDTFGVSGPALPEDPENQIYDDWGLHAPQQTPLFTSHEDSYFQAAGTEPLGTDGDCSSDMSSLHPRSECYSKNSLDPIDPLLAPKDVEDYGPWPSKEHFLIDTMSAFPRSVFSQTEMDAMRWFTSKCGINGLPTLSEVQRHRKAILKAAGADTKLVDGDLGNSFALNDFSRILAHEMANPCVRPHLRFYAEDCGKHVSEARHGSRWAREVNANLAGPMARLECGGSFIDFYVHEIALANVDSYGTYAPVLPTRWFERSGKLFARTHRVQVNSTRTAFIIDASHCADIPLSAFFASLVELKGSHRAYGLPSPTEIE
ncbi:hypothetical protein FRB90_008233, partial [Tulasnella sp. 427]